MADEEPRIDEILLTPISEMISQIGDSIVDASTTLNQNQVKLLRDYPDDLKSMGIIPTLFHMQEVVVELKMALHITKTTTDERTEKIKNGMFSTPINATYTNEDQFDTSGASSVKMVFAPAPPPPSFENATGEEAPDTPTPDAPQPNEGDDADGEI